MSIDPQKHPMAAQFRNAVADIDEGDPVFGDGSFLEALFAILDKLAMMPCFAGMSQAQFSAALKTPNRRQRAALNRQARQAARQTKLGLYQRFRAVQQATDKSVEVAEMMTDEEIAILHAEVQTLVV